MLMETSFALNGPLIHKSIKTSLNESKFDLSDVLSQSETSPSLLAGLETLSLEAKLALAGACLERVSLAIFAGCVDVKEFIINSYNRIVEKFDLRHSELDDIRKVVRSVDDSFEADPLSFFVQLRSGVIEIHPLTYYVQYFYLAYVILYAEKETIPRECQETLLRLKFLYIYASVLNDPCPLIKKKLDDMLERMDELTQLSVEEQIEFSLILANSFLIYSEIAKAIEAFEFAKKLSGIQFEFTGELGKRTFFQQNDLPQLFAKASLVSKQEFTPGIIADDTPKALKLDDDTVMPEIKRTDLKTEERVQLFPAQLACMVTSLVIMQKNEAPDEILFEKAESFISEILNYKLVYGVQLRALLARCLVESERKRKVERACMQAEVLRNDLLGIHTINGINGDLTIEQYRRRFPWLLASNARPFWFYCRCYASILLRLGANGEALRVYNDIYDYDALVECYISIGQADKAETMVRNLLKIKESPYRLCLMGTITKDEKWYEKAIELSKDNSAEARTNLGLLMMKKNKYEDAFQHLKRAVEIKPLQTSTLFSLGHVAYKLERYADAVAAYRNCVNVEPNDYEPWNNLSASFVHLNKPEQAQRTMKEALKFNRNHPEMWRNYSIMSINVADYGQAIHAIQEYMKCSKKLDINEIVQKLLLSIVQIKEESSFATLRKEAVLMMGQLSSKIILDADTLFCYALLKKPTADCSDPIIWRGYLDTASKAIQKYISSTPWKSQEDALFNALQLATDILIAERTLNCLNVEGQKVAEHSGRITSILKEAKEAFGDKFEGVSDDRLKNLLEKATEMV